MLDGPLVFVDIDTQRDFLEPSGALYVPGSTEILPNLERLTAFARARGIPVLATACAHTLDEPDPEPFPPHCLVGTPGQSRVAATSWPGGTVLGADARFEGPSLPSHLTIEKHRYDVFTHPDAARVVSLYALKHPTFVVYGVATDYCVKAAVLGLLERGGRVAVVTDAIRAVDPAAEPAVLAEFVRFGAVLTTTEGVVGGG
ncbi:MAG TPA: isochorismatase family cysteine hydrolase [Isosphaeraceae bacterium]|jgi:nicotinamidase/pyrazinamidase|nr:isochorismatase family cysteine hydrolase [Isosphaeraceae bacterium]